jgi:DNA-binding transcriptional regulator LsrR (DeoR family)
MARREHAGHGATEWPEQLATRVAWLYYMAGLTQAEVADKLSLPRMRVNRLLQDCRDRGVVSVSINSPLAENVALEEKLGLTFALKTVRVALARPQPHDREDEDLARLLGRIAAPVATSLATPGSSIGVGWGVTLKAVAEAMVPLPPRGVSVISMLGSLNRRSAIDIYEASTRMSQKLSAECFYMASPLFCDNREARDAILRQPMIADILDRASRTDAAILSIGGVRSGTIGQAGMVSEEEVAELESSGAVANFLGHYIDGAARPVDHPIEGRVVGLLPERLAGVTRRLMVSGGPPKVPGLAAVLRAGLVTDLVTDQATARALLDL